MWIKKTLEIEDSFACHLNFLWKDDERPIYIMDNHLAALWCWLNNLSEGDQYTLFHVDSHWDCQDMPDSYKDKLRLINQESLDEFLAVESNDKNIPAVRWDNYIDPLIYLRPNLFKAFLTAHQKNYNERIFENEKVNKYELVELFFSDLSYNLESSEGKILFNLDLDFLFWNIKNSYIQVFSDDFINMLARNIKRYLNNDMVLTIALSPECCGGWKNTLNVCKVFCERLDIDFPIPEITRLLK